MDLSGFTIVRAREMGKGFPSGYRALSIRKNNVGFSAELYRAMGKPQYVRFLVNEAAGKLAVVPAEYRDDNACKVCITSGQGVSVNRKCVTEYLRKMAGLTDGEARKLPLAELEESTKTALFNFAAEETEA